MQYFGEEHSSFFVTWCQNPDSLGLIRLPDNETSSLIAWMPLPHQRGLRCSKLLSSTKKTWVQILTMKHSCEERWCFVVRQTDQPQTVRVLTSRHKEAWTFLSCTAWLIRYVMIIFLEHVEAVCLSNIWFYGVDMLCLYRTIEDISKKTSKYDIDFVFDWKHSKSVFIDMISWQTSLM